MTRRRGSWCGRVMVVIALAAACTDDDEASTPPPTTRVNGIPVLAGSTRGPGTELADRFEVPDETVLVGEVEPFGPWALWGRNQERGWRATLLVVGDPARAIGDFHQQGVALGYGPPIDPSENPCTGGRSSSHICELTLDRTTATADRLRLQSVRSPSDVEDSPGRSTPASLMTVIFTSGKLMLPPPPPPPPPSPFPAPPPTLPPPPMIPAGFEPPPPTAPPTAPPLRTDWPPLPQVGDFLYRSRHYGEIRVEPGSAIAYPVGAGAEGVCSFLHAVFRVDGDPHEVAEGYLEQLDSLTFDDEPLEVHEIGGATVYYALTGGTPGEIYELAVVDREGSPDWGRITGCTD